jgi:hypothetical protein
VKTFRFFVEDKCNVKANELKPGDKVKDINQDCEEYGAEGTVQSVEEIRDGKRVAGNLVKIKANNGNKGTNTFKKTEIQLKKIN